MALPRSLSALTLAVLACGLLLAAPANAELPPLYRVWNDFGAVVDQTSIPRTLGVVDAIERRADGRFFVWAGACYVEVLLIRAPATDSHGQPLGGPSQIKQVKVSEKHCKPK
jgi:hypothetical protein